MVKGYEWAIHRGENPHKSINISKVIKKKEITKRFHLLPMGLVKSNVS